MVIFDASYLLPLFNKKASVSLSDAADRVAFLFDQLSRAKEKIVVPTPALAELLVRAGPAASEYVRIVTTTAAFQVADFDVRAAIEVSQQFEAAVKTGDKRGGVPEEVSRQKIKFDRQIIAIARVTGCTVIYSDDSDFKTLTSDKGPQVIPFAELPPPPDEAQFDMRFDAVVEPEDDEPEA
jgi:predicted nucleic acid-binding protein